MTSCYCGTELEIGKPKTHLSFVEAYCPKCKGWVLVPKEGEK
jgi:hypothetical protein